MADQYPEVDYDNIEIEEELKIPQGGKKAAAGKHTDSSIHTASFKDHMLKSELLRALQDCGFEHPSDVQQQCIPKARMGVDILCQAKSGMGKTAVFVLSLLDQFQEKQAPISALVLTHNREIAY